MEKSETERIEILNDLAPGDRIRLHEDEEDGFPEIEVTFIAYDNGYDVISVETPEDGVFEVDGMQFKEVIGRANNGNP